MNPAPRADFCRHIDAANVDLKGFTEDFYAELCAGRLAPVLDTLRYLVHETSVWVEITTLLIPGHNDSDAELERLTRWVVDQLGPNVPLHFSAFHPDYKLLDVPPTPPATLARARGIALANGVRYAYTGNVTDRTGQSTACHACGALLIERDGYEIGTYRVRDDGCCGVCGAQVPGVFAGPAGHWGSRRLPVRIAAFAADRNRPVPA
jgi:pyruvate formate lyase activating enzyme